MSKAKASLKNMYTHAGTSELSCHVWESNIVPILVSSSPPVDDSPLDIKSDGNPQQIQPANTMQCLPILTHGRGIAGWNSGNPAIDILSW